MLVSIITEFLNLDKFMNIGNTIPNPTKTNNFAVGNIVRNVATDAIGVIDTLSEDGSFYILSYDPDWQSGWADYWQESNIVAVPDAVGLRWVLNIPEHTLLYKLANGEAV